MLKLPRVKRRWYALASVIVLVVFLWIYLGRYPNFTEIADVRRSTLVELRPDMLPGDNVFGVRWNVHGYIDGTAVLSQMHPEGNADDYVIGPGFVNKTIGGDWYAPVCVLAYEPKGVTYGRLTIDYRFDVLLEPAAEETGAPA